MDNLEHTRDTDGSLLRTSVQNRSLHLYFEHVASALDEAGIDLQEVLSKSKASIPATKENIKEAMWRPIQKAMYNKKSTTELTTKEVGEVYEVLNRFLGEQFGINVEFPHIPDINEN